MFLQNAHNLQDTVDLNAEVEKLPPFPQIILLRSDIAEEQCFIAVEKQVMVESRCINTALLDMMSVYFTFDIAYPRLSLTSTRHTFFSTDFVFFLCVCMQ